MVGSGLRAAAARNARLQGRLPRGDDDSGSLMFALLLVFLASALAGLMTPVLLISINATRSDQRRITALASAQAGIDVIIGQIRASNDGTAADVGVLTLLPCGTLTNSVGVGGNGRYQVTVSYFATGSDPRGHDASWLSANAIQCIVGSGARSAPGYALIQSLGTDQASGSFSTVPVRTLQATYVFHTNNANIAGGLVHVYKTSTSTDLCIDAGSGSPAVGTTVTMQVCTAGSSRQKFAYNTNLTLSLTATATTTQTTGSLCLDASTPEAANAVVKLQSCGTTTLPQQEWSINDSANFQGTNDGSNLNNLCFNVQSPNVVGSSVILSTNCGGGYDNQQTFQPDAAVGAGAAGVTSGQLVNFNQFGRCLDVTNFDVNYAYMIAWPCKQAPNPNNVGWNQRWTLPTITSPATSASGQITTNDTSNSTKYCLTSPGSTASGQYVTVTACPTTPPTSMTWTVYGKTTDTTSSYRITDYNGFCLQPTDPNATPPDLFPSGNNISKLTVGVCGSSTLQKWNAPPTLFQSAVTDVGEK